MMPRSSSVAASSCSALLMLDTLAPVASASCSSVAGSLATNSTASRRLRRLGECDGMFFRSRSDGDVGERRRLGQAHLVRANEFQHREKGYDDLQPFAAGDETEQAQLRVQLELAHHVADLGDDGEGLAFDHQRSG